MPPSHFLRILLDGEAVRAAREDAQVLRRVEALVAWSHVRHKCIRNQAAQRGWLVGERRRRGVPDCDGAQWAGEAAAAARIGH